MVSVSFAFVPTKYTTSFRHNFFQRLPTITTSIPNPSPINGIQQQSLSKVRMKKKQNRDLSSNTSNAHRQTLVEKNNDSSTYYQAEQIIKKSRFIGIAKHCTSWSNAQNFIASIRSEHNKARHVCFGFVSGHNPVQERCSDDGEPTGTAGVPILGSIKNEDLSDTVCAVVRYSGGVKLGAGGLIRAYGGTTRLVLREADTMVLIPKSILRITTPSANTGQLYATVSKFGGSTSDESYAPNGEFKITVVLESNDFKAMIHELSDATRGAFTFEEL